MAKKQARAGGGRPATRVATLRATYGKEFAKGVAGDMKVSTLLEQAGAQSLSDYITRYGSRGVGGKGLSRASISVIVSTSVKFGRALKKLADK